MSTPVVTNALAVGLYNIQNSASVTGTPAFQACDATGGLLLSGSLGASASFNVKLGTGDQLLYSINANPRLQVQCPTGIDGMKISGDATPFVVTNLATNGAKFYVNGVPDVYVQASAASAGAPLQSAPIYWFTPQAWNGSSTFTPYQFRMLVKVSSTTAPYGGMSLGSTSTSGADALYIQSDGLVGVGTMNNLSARLTVSGVLSASSVSGTSGTFQSLVGTTASGTTAQFTTVSGVNATGTTAQFTTVSGVNVTGTSGTFQDVLINGSSIALVSSTLTSLSQTVSGVMHSSSLAPQYLYLTDVSSSLVYRIYMSGGVLTSSVA